jgi:hypothetical protein
MQIPGMTSEVPDIAAGKSYGGGFNTEGYGIRFLMPRDGFKDNSFLFTYLVEYRIPWTDPTANPRDVTVNFDGDGKAGTLKVESHTSDIVNNTLIGYLKVSIGHDYGLNVVRCFIGPVDAPLYEAFIRTERLEGFIDVDNDGLDDRTKRPDSNTENPWDYDDYNPNQAPQRNEYGDDIIGTVQYGFDTLFYWLLSPFRLIGDGLNAIIEVVGSTFNWATNFSTLMANLFSFLPSEVTGMLTLAFVSMIIVTVIKVVHR